MIKSGSDLKVGDHIKVWWKPGTDLITNLTPYSGPLKCLKDAMIADFAINKTGMTIEPHGIFKVTS